MAKVLIVDDVPANRDLLVTLLGYGGHILLEAAGGREGLAQARAERPDLVITDLLMPEIDGYEFVRALRAEPATARTQVIFYSAVFSEAEARVLAQASGVSIFIPKPAEPQQILEAVNTALQAPAALATPLAEEGFHREHLRLLTTKLADKMLELEALNAELERRVAERTAQLEMTNKELEAFTFSVAHDLRAPLRSIGSFSTLVLEDYADRLDATGENYLRRVAANAGAMEQMINALLELARYAHADLRRDTVRLSEMAHSIAEDLRLSQPERPVEFVIAAGLTANGDGRLLRVALTNLMNNAWKYTGRRPTARIEFGCAEGEQQLGYFVRDNGAGFDMAYAGKLFGAFQRLHSAAQFPGLGIGLATVQRIIRRHGGRVWAEGEMDKGATFYFTLDERSG